jgi:hypothetical protein
MQETTPRARRFSGCNRVETDDLRLAEWSGRVAEYDSAVIAFVLAFGLVLQGAPGRGAVAPGVVTGQILTREGVPATFVRVAAIPAPPARAREGLNYYVPPAPTRVTETDGQGRYRLTNLPPGEYLIAAGLIGVGTYYPNETDWLRASAVAVTAEPATIDIRMVTPTGARVAGRVTPPPAAGSGEIAVLSGVSLAEVAEIAVGADGRFEFGRVPAGRYLVSLFPTPPGFGSLAVDLRDSDATGLEIKRPLTQAVSGRVVTSGGPIPKGLLALVSDRSYVPIAINTDGTFTARAHAARHRFEFSGMPAGYRLISARQGSQDVSQGLTVGNADISGLVVTVEAPRDLPRVKGTIAGLRGPATVEMRGPIIGALTTTVGKDGIFEFPAATPGLYYLRIPEAAELGTVPVVVSRPGAEIQLKVPKP